MDKQFITSSHSSRVILIFAGWGMDFHPLASLEKPGYDIAVVWNYTDFTPADFDDVIATLRPYTEVVVVAWSFGVRIAADFLSRAKGVLPITRAIAVNGTTQHIHDLCGIPVAIFNGTLQHLCDVTVRKFLRRMFNSAQEFSAFQESAPQRSFESLLAELQTFAKLPPVEPNVKLWDCAIGGTLDAIFPIANQRRGWQGVRFIEMADMPHFPDFATILNNEVIDKELVATRFSAALNTYSESASVQADVARRLWQMAKPAVDSYLANTSSTNVNVLEIGVGSGMLTSLYADTLQGTSLELCDIAGVPPEVLPDWATYHCCDAEADIYNRQDCSVDIILSASALQWFNSPTTYMSEVMRVLRPSGLAIFSLFGINTFTEIKSLTGNTLHYPSLQALCDSVEHQGRIIIADEQTLTLTFDSPREVMQHIKRTGVNALQPHSAAATLRLVRNYPLTADGMAPLTYHPLYLIVEKFK